LHKTAATQREDLLNDVLDDEDIIYPSENELLLTGRSYLPWSSNTLNEALEEIETPIPRMFSSEVIEEVMTPFEKLMRDYLNMIDTHVTEEGRLGCPELLVYLREVAYKVFVRHNYDGLKGVEPLDFIYSADKPESFCSKIKPIHPRRLDSVKKELFRMAEVGIIELIDKPRYASTMIDADKATEPFVRLCGGYHEHVNKYIVAPHAYIPPIIKSLERLKGFKFYIELDWAHSFRQFPLSQEASEYLTIITQKKKVGCIGGNNTLYTIKATEGMMITALFRVFYF
jgi:hypothetical protein